MDCSRVGEQSLSPALLDTSDSSCAGAEVSTAGVVINSSFNCCTKGCRLIWSGREGVTTRPGCQQRSLLFQELHPCSVQNVSSSETAGREQGGVNRRTWQNLQGQGSAFEKVEEIIYH